MLLQTLRSCTKTSNKVNASQYCHIVKGVIMTLMRGGKNATSLPVMQSKRGMAKSELCIADDWNKAEEDYWPDDPSMHSAIDSAFQDMEQLLSRDLSSEGSAGEYNMWTHKWKAPANKRAKTGPASSGPSSRSTVCLGMNLEDIASQLRPFIDRIKDAPALMKRQQTYPLQDPLNVIFKPVTVLAEQLLPEHDVDDGGFESLPVRQTLPDDLGYTNTHEEDFEDLPPEAAQSSGSGSSGSSSIASLVDDTFEDMDAGGADEKEDNSHLKALASSSSTRISNAKRVKQKIEGVMSKMLIEAVDIPEEGAHKELVKRLRKLAYQVNTSLADQQLGRAERFMQMQSRFKTARNMRRRWQKLQNKLTNKVTDLHWKTCTFLTTSFQKIFIPTFGVKGMVGQHRVIGCRTARQMLELSHGRFLERLRHSARTKQREVYIVPEAYTTKTRGRCGVVNENEDSKMCDEFVIDVKRKTTDIGETWTARWGSSTLTAPSGLALREVVHDKLLKDSAEARGVPEAVLASKLNRTWRVRVIEKSTEEDDDVPMFSLFD
ncbi:hypothetical protein CEUSTIGMA_g13284.t1 [Chlamydomonas eustigma]|uniref:Uncharacterized protein n=1 Tax=Chlamydomonas eustigma TaxID=1157962 RepID=A0A250XS29_9CHLO|nr:hypothetical protein CEUSTIGMA_g13284.t1 [Chlamydomonas eustigma]|eukprot:GAX85868.1 hypothetical protein CEUSTIGMA_g13284.t1 [Chlamydomonas eustigma]